MQKRSKLYTYAILGIIALLLVTGVGTFAIAHRSNAAPSSNYSNLRVSAQRRTAQPVYTGTIDMSKVPQATAAQQKQAGRSLPFLTKLSAKARRAAQLAHNTNATPHNAGYTPIHPLTRPENPSLYNGFGGMSDSAATCPYFGGCAPPDMAIAAGQGSLELQAVNTSVALYNNLGALQSGWPKTFQSFFGIPNPTPTGCDPAGPFTSDPRAIYDTADAHYIVAALQVENAFGLSPNCTEVSKYWFAVSTTSNPNGTWKVFSLDMTLGTINAADFTQMGVNGDGIYFAANMFNQAGNAFPGAEIFACPKQAIYNTTSVTCTVFQNPNVNGLLLDTPNPVNSIAPDGGVQAEFFVSSFNGGFNGDPNGDNCVTAACTGAVILAISDTANVSGKGPVLSSVVVSTKSYTLPPAADEPGCTGGAGCIDSGDNRVSATPIYRAGFIYAGHNTGIVNSSSQTVPGIQWWQFQPVLSVGFPVTLTSVTVARDSYLNASSGFVAVMYPALMVTESGDVLIVYDYMGDTINPSINDAWRRATDPQVGVQGLGTIQKAGVAPYGTSFVPACSSSNVCRWGDYEASSYDISFNDNTWLAAQYSNASGDWSTWILRMKFQITGA